MAATCRRQALYFIKPTSLFCRFALAIAAVFCISSQASAQPQGGLPQPQGGPNVTVVNTPLPVTVTNQAMSGTPVAFTLGNNPGEVLGTMFPSNQGPLVIEYISGFCSNGMGTESPFIQITTVTGGVTNKHSIHLPLPPVPARSTDWQFGHLVKIYADAGTNVALSLNSIVCHLVFSGQIVTP
jgi:hypothetical protein